MKRMQVILIDDSKYVVKHKFDERFQKVIEKFGVDTIVEELTQDSPVKIVKTKDNKYFIAELIPEANVIELEQN